MVLRLMEMPVFMWIGAFLASVGMALLQDPFTWALGMLVFSSIFDYATGVATARAIPPGQPNTYDPARAARGRREKIITAVLMIGCRMMEGLATEVGILDVGGILRWFGADALASAPAIQQGGIFTTVVTMLIAAQELFSIYEHRLANGGSRILVLEFAFSTINAIQTFVLGRAASKVAEWAKKDAGDELRDAWEAQQMMDDLAHRARHGTPAPRRRPYDHAISEMKEEQTSTTTLGDDERKQQPKDS